MRNSCIIVACCWCLFALSTQAQETDAQKLLLDSVKYDKLDVAGVKTALDKGANPNWVSDTRRRYSVIGEISIIRTPRNKIVGGGREREKAVEILQMLFKGGAKLQPCGPSGIFSLLPPCFPWMVRFH